MKTSVPVALALLLLSTSAVWSQQSSNKNRKSTQLSTYKLTAVKVTGTERYTDKEILPATGLQLGQNVGEEEFKGAVQRLAETGLFSDVAYSYSYSPAGTKLEFQLADIAQKNLVPAHFENLVWFTDAELLAELQKRVPLFKQSLPVAGALPDHVAEALQAILDEKHLPGRVDYLRESPQEGGRLIGIAYSVDGVDFVIRDVGFPGASPDLLPGLQAASRRLSGAKYRRSSLGKVAEVDFLPVCWKRGYLKALLADSTARVVSQSADEVDVDAAFPITPGKVYSTSDVVWKGNAALATTQLQSLIHLPPGQPADAVRLEKDLEEIGKLYRNHGYMMAHVTAAPTMDDEKSTVYYDLNVVEGDQFKMGDLELVGLDAQETARMQEAWSLAEGQPYNASYPQKFLEKTFHAQPGGAHWSAHVNEAVNEKDKTVDVTIRFTPR